MTQPFSPCLKRCSSLVRIWSELSSSVTLSSESCDSKVRKAFLCLREQGCAQLGLPHGHHIVQVGVEGPRLASLTPAVGFHEHFSHAECFTLRGPCAALPCLHSPPCAVRVPSMWCLLLLCDLSPQLTPTFPSVLGV